MNKYLLGNNITETIAIFVFACSLQKKKNIFHFFWDSQIKYQKKNNSMHKFPHFSILKMDIS